MKRLLASVCNIWAATYTILQSVEASNRNARRITRLVGLSNGVDTRASIDGVAFATNAQCAVGLFGTSLRSIPRGGDTSGTSRNGQQHDEWMSERDGEEGSEEEDEDAWRERLPVQLQKRRGALYRLVLPTGYKRRRDPSGQPTTDHPGNVDMNTGSNDNGGVNSTDNDGEDVTCQVYLLGTAHVSKDSSTDAKMLMEHIKPDVLFVELCNQRLNLLTDDGPNSLPPLPPTPPTPTTDHNATEHTDQDTLSVRQMYQAALRSNPNLSRSAALSSVLLTKVQGDYATKLDVNIGQELKEAHKVARLQHHFFGALFRNVGTDTPGDGNGKRPQ